MITSVITNLITIRRKNMDYNIKNYGAKGDGNTLDTQSIQDAIDDCSKNGGGRVVIDNGVFMTGTIILKDNVDLHISGSGKILGSPNCGEYEETEDKTLSRDLWGKAKSNGDYPDFDKKHVDKDKVPRFRSSALIFAEEVKNISISGEGTIDCNGDKFIEHISEGDNWWMPYRRIEAPTPPRVVFFTGCENVCVKDITMINQPAGWSYWIHDCDYVNFDRIKITANVEYPNNDGIHINSSRNVTVSNSSITCGDDSIIVRANNVSLKENKVCERVVVTNCNLTSHSAGIRLGWINDGIIRNCTFSNLVMTDTSVGISIYIPAIGDCSPSDIGREKTLIENMSFSNIIMDDNYSFPVLIWPADKPGTNIAGIRNIYYSNIHSRGYKLPMLCGTEEHPLENISFSDCSFEIKNPPDSDIYLNHGGTYGPAPDDPVINMKHIKDISLNNTKFIVY